MAHEIKIEHFPAEFVDVSTELDFPARRFTRTFDESYMAFCVCGWHSQSRSEKSDAEADADLHVALESQKGPA